MTIRELREMYLDGATIGELAKLEGLPQIDIKHALGLTNRMDKRTSDYAKYYDQGLNDREIGEATGRCRETINLWRKRTGRPRNRCQSIPDKHTENRQSVDYGGTR